MRHSDGMTDVQKQSRASGIAILLTSGLSNQVGAAVGSFAFPVIGPVGVVAMRQFVAALVLLPVARPKFWRFSWAQWWPILLLAVVFGTMNLSLYTAIDRIGLGLAVTLEFLGPLAVALLSSRSRATLICAGAAIIGVLCITQPSPTADFIGIGLGVVAAACWAAYILLNRTVGRRVPGVGGTAMATAVSALVYLPIGIVTLSTTKPSMLILGFAVIAGVLSSAVPYVCDLIALRRVPAHLFSLLMSVHPVFAALVGAVVLGQALNVGEWIGIALITGANVAALLLNRNGPSESAVTDESGDPVETNG